MAIVSNRNELSLQRESNPVYYIIKAIRLFLRSDKNNPSQVEFGSGELFPYSENDLERVGKILFIRDLRRTAWYFLDYGAATAWILQTRLEITESTIYRHLKDLRTYNFIARAAKSRLPKHTPGGPRPDIWMVPDATIDQINEAQTLHWRLASPKYVTGERLGQLILEEYMEPRHLDVITKREVWAVAREKSIKGELSDIVELAMNYLGEKGVKVWR